jgi:hypothetical protein
MTDCLEYLSRTYVLLASLFTHSTCHAKPRYVALQYFFPLSQDDLLDQLAGAVNLRN